MKFLLLIATVFLFGCSDARQAKFGSFGKQHTIVCFSGNKKIYEGTSTGKVNSSDQSDGYYFFEKESKVLIEVSGNCIIKRID